MVKHRLRSPLILSLTSYPPRFSTLICTLKSLLLQTMNPDLIVLWIAYDDVKFLPSDILSLQSDRLVILYTYDIRSYKKIIPCLERFPNAYICTADDDLYYEPTWLEELVAAVGTDDMLVPCHRAHGIKTLADGSFAPYKTWEFEVQERRERPDLFPTSGAGVLYPPQILRHGPQDRKIALELCPTADDIWLFWIARRNGARFQTIGKARKLKKWQGSQDVRMATYNVIEGGNDKQIKQIAELWGYPRISD